jgi:hypothetical protein
MGLPDTLFFADPADTPFADSFPDATLAAVGRIADLAEGVQYFQATDELFAELGFRTEEAFFKNLEPEVLLTFPFDEATAIDQSFRLFRNTAGVADTVEVTQTVVADAWGEVITPLGRFPTLRVKRLRRDSFSVFGLPVIVENTIYEFWTNEYIVPVFSVEYQLSRLFGGIDESLTGQYLFAQDISTAVTRPELSGAALRVFPNPASGQVSVDYELPFRHSARLLLFDPLGRAIHRIDLGEKATGVYRQSIELNRLTPGLYRVVLYDGRRQLAARPLLVY